MPVRTYVENIPGAATPTTLALLTLGLEQAAPVSTVSVGGRLKAANVVRARLTWQLGLTLAGLRRDPRGPARLAGGRRSCSGRWVRSSAAPSASARAITRARWKCGRDDALGGLEQALERMRARLRQSTINKSYLHSVLNSMTDAVFVTSPDGVIKIANAAACKLLGYSEEELLGKRHRGDPR